MQNKRSNEKLDETLTGIEEKLEELKRLEAELKRKNQETLSQLFLVRYRVGLLETAVRGKR